MSMRDLVVLGSASAVPTRRRNHNGYFLRWDGHGFLFDPGEGTQRQLTMAGIAVSDLTWLCVTHFHGDHCLGVPGILQRIARDQVGHPVDAVYPASPYWERLRHASSFHDVADIREHPLTGEVVELEAGGLTLTARRLDHGIEAYGYRLVEPDGRTMLPDRLREHGISGPQVRGLSGPLLQECSVVRRGQKVAFVMDTRLCDAVFELADGVDLLVIESTFLDADERLAAAHGHLTARQAGRVAREAGVRRL
ncbi:MAG: MBL fold metallo-hydrolase, partial [Streptosporangiaceae bacterium]